MTDHLPTNPTAEELSAQGHAAWQRDDLKAAETHLKACLAMVEKAAQAQGQDPTAQLALADALADVADLMLDKEAHQESSALYRRALRITQEVAQSSPTVQVDYDLALLHLGLGDALDELHQPEEAAECWESALSIANRLTRAVEADEQAWHLLCQCLYRMTYLHAELDDQATVADLLIRWKNALSNLPRELRADFEEEYNRLTRAMSKKK